MPHPADRVHGRRVLIEGARSIYYERATARFDIQHFKNVFRYTSIDGI